VNKNPACPVAADIRRQLDRGMPVRVWHLLTDRLGGRSMSSTGCRGVDPQLHGTTVYRQNANIEADALGLVFEKFAADRAFGDLSSAISKSSPRRAAGCRIT
jgi:hypothetical protein